MGKKEAMQEIKDLIDEKAAKRKAMREGSKEDATHVQEVLRCLNNLDLLAQEATNEVDMHVAMEGQCKMLYSRLRSFDPYVRAKVDWNEPQDWRDLRPVGIRIFWSGYYLRLHPEANEEEYIDVSRLLLDDYE